MSLKKKSIWQKVMSNTNSSYWQYLSVNLLREYVDANGAGKAKKKKTKEEDRDIEDGSSHGLVRSNEIAASIAWFITKGLLSCSVVESTKPVVADSHPPWVWFCWRFSSPVIYFFPLSSVTLGDCNKVKL